MEVNDSCTIEIDGGYTVVDASGDGVDTNGSFTLNDGVLLVSGSTNSGNDAIDHMGDSTVNGGTLLALGTTGMTEDFTGGSQAFICTALGFTGTAGQTVAVTDADGNVLVSYTAPKSFNMVQASSGRMSEGTSVSVVVNGVVADAGEDGFASSGAVTGGTSISLTSSATSSYRSGTGGAGLRGA